MDRVEKRRKRAYQSVPSTSNTIPFSGGALWGFPFTGSKGANRFGGPRVAFVVILREYDREIVNSIKHSVGLAADKRL